MLWRVPATGILRLRFPETLGATSRTTLLRRRQAAERCRSRAIPGRPRETFPGLPRASRRRMPPRGTTARRPPCGRLSLGREQDRWSRTTLRNPASDVGRAADVGPRTASYWIRRWDESRTARAARDKGANPPHLPAAFRRTG